MSFASIKLDGTRANLVWAASIQLIEKLTGYLVIVVLTRTLARAEVGAMFFTATISGLAATFVSFGADTYLVRAIALEPDKALAHLSGVLSLRLRSAALVFILLNAGGWLIWPELGPVLLLVSAYDFLEEIYACFSAFFIGQRKVLFRLATGGLFKVLTLAAVFGAATLTHSLLPVLLSYFLVNSMLVLVTIAVIRRRFGPISLAQPAGRDRELMRLSAPFFLLNFLTLVHIRLDTLMVGVLLNLVQVAYYDLGIKLLEVTRVILRPLNMVSYPILSEMAARGDRSRLRLRAAQLIAGAFTLGLLPAAGMQFLGSGVILWLFGPGYSESIAPARILFLCVPFFYMTFVLTFLANALHLEKGSAWLLAASVAMNLALNIVVIPARGISGAAWTTLVSQAFLALAMLWMVGARLVSPPERP
jgi:O-antigen/teichoic acid export membrane protein